MIMRRRPANPSTSARFAAGGAQAVSDAEARNIASYNALRLWRTLADNGMCTALADDVQIPLPMPIDGLSSAASALRYFERKQEVLANNLANVSTDGFKQQRVFARLMDSARPAADATSDMSGGALRQTGSPLDVALDTDGFLVVNTATGERYRRGGSLRMDLTHRLVDESGRPVLGRKGPIVLDDSPVEISTIGEVRQHDTVIDQLRIERAPAGTSLDREGSTLFVPPTKREPAAPDAVHVKQGFLEDSNVNSTGALVDMIAVQRAYASAQKAIIEIDAVHETAATELAKPL